MRASLRIPLFLILTLSSIAIATAQTSTSVEQLRSQLSDIQAKEAALQDRIKQLDEDLLPQNIEKYFALNGSTHPEELREQRRRQLENQKASVQSQLTQLATSRARSCDCDGRGRSISPERAPPDTRPAIILLGSRGGHCEYWQHNRAA